VKLLRRDALNGEAFGSYRVIDKRELANDFRKIFIEQVVQPPEQNAGKTVAHWHPEKMYRWWYNPNRGLVYEC
jgi:hypothetical protein